MISFEDIKKSLTYVAENSDYVAIDSKAIDKYLQDFSPDQPSPWMSLCPFPLYKFKKDEDLLDFLFLIGSQAFCFWGYPEKWKIKYREMVLDGWWALVAVFQKALEDNIPVLEGGYISGMTMDDVRELFAGTPEIPLLKERLNILNKIGQKLVSVYDGRFHHAIRKPIPLPELINLIRNFEGFNDVAKFKGEKVYFFKKVQVVIGDMITLLSDTKYQVSGSIDEMPGHADYKIPGLLRSLGILVYNQELSDLVDKRKIIPASNRMEVEIRANMLVAVRIMVDKLRKIGVDITPIKLNGILWNASQKKGSLKYPYHLTETVYY